MSSLSQAPEEIALPAASTARAVEAADEPGLTPDLAAPAQRRRFALLSLKGPTARKWLIGAAAIAAVYSWDQTLARPDSAGYADVVVGWLVGIGCLLLATADWPAPSVRAWPAHVAAWARMNRTDLALGAAITVVALALRAIALGAYPFVYSGDEAQFGIAASNALSGAVTNPFGTGWFTNPSMYAFMESWTIGLFGHSVGGARAISALMGTLAVAATYLLVRRLLGRATAVVAALLLAAFHFHIHFSRLSLNNVMDSLLLPIGLYTLDRALFARSRVFAVLAGLAIGFGQYFYWGSHLLLPLAAIYLSYAFVKEWLPAARAAAEPGHELQRGASVVGWIAAAALLCYAPLGGYYMQHPDVMNGRINQVSIFQSGWLSREMQNTGNSAPALIEQQIEKAVLLPFQTRPSAVHYRNDRPFVGFPFAPLLAVGLVITTLGWWRREFFGLATAYWLATIGLGLTEDPTQTQRYVIAAPLMMIAVAVALLALGQIAQHVLGLRRTVIEALGAAVVVGLCVWSLEYYFFVPSQANFYGGDSSYVATVLGDDLHAMGGNPMVYFFGPPRMSYNGFEMLPFLAPDAQATDVSAPIDAASAPLPLRGTTVFAFLPERSGELQVVRDWYPQGTAQAFPNESGGPLLLTYTVQGG